MVSLKRLMFGFGGGIFTWFFFTGWRKYFTLPLMFLLLWWLPWAPILHTGVLVYFPYEEDGAQRFLRISGPLGSMVGSHWTPFANIPNACVKSLVASEDTLFYEHSGVDWKSTQKSLLQSLPMTSFLFDKATRHSAVKSSKHHAVQGGSTITQQLVKNAFLSRSKSYFRKSREIAGALLLDLTTSKETQLLWYFNIVEFGPKVYGIEEAANWYFKKAASELNATQCAQLIAVLPSPIKWGRSLKKGGTSTFISKRTQIILTRANIIAKRSDKVTKVPEESIESELEKTSKSLQTLDQNEGGLIEWEDADGKAEPILPTPQGPTSTGQEIESEPTEEQ
jgi:monofunctional glycosyltransferase